MAFKFNTTGQIGEFLEVGDKYINDRRIIYELDDDTYSVEVDTCRDNLSYLQGVADAVKHLVND